MSFHKLIFIVIVIIITTCSNHENCTKVNFSFEDNEYSENSWITVTAGGVFLQDTLNCIDGSQSWLLTSSSLSSGFSSFVFQYFNLPIEAHQIILAIHSKTEIINDVWLKAYLLDKDENLIARDSVSLFSPDSWSRISLTLSSRKARKVYIEIQAQSKDTFILDNHIQQKLWIDNLELKFNSQNNQSLVSLESQINQQKAEFRNKHLDINEKTLDISKIEDFKQHRIIALGESVHGSRELQLFAFDAIRKMISINNCKLVLLELPFEIGLRLNDYIIGETNEDIQSLLMFFNYNIPEIEKLFEWIRDFNRQTQSKVHISGIDINHSFLTEDHLLTFLENQNEQAELDVIIELMKQKKYNKAMTTLKQSKFIYLSLGQIKYESILRALKYRNGLLYPKPSLVEGDREYIQFQNTKFAIESYLKDKDKAIIYAHLGHVNKRNSTYSRLYIPCLGNYMNKLYSDDYFVAALLVGDGSITNTDSALQCKGFSIENPEIGSIEEICMEWLDDKVFYQNTNVSNSAQSYRCIGSFLQKNQFYPFVQEGRFDAFIFFRHSTSYPISAANSEDNQKP